MKQPMRTIVLGAVLASAVVAGGCANYYMVRDPGTGNTYYTTDVDRPGSGGTVRFRDERTGSVVTLPKSEVREISRYDYQSAVGAR
jgi:hypothetical protein